MNIQDHDLRGRPPLRGPERAERGLHAFLREAKRLHDGSSRTADLVAKLDAWIVRPQQRLALFYNPLDKSLCADVLAWSRALSERGDASVVFLPVRRRFQTALERDLLGLLGARLIALRAHDSVPHDIAGLRAAITDAVGDGCEGGRQVVLVLEGVDEWIDTMAPLLEALKHTGVGVRVVLTARVESELEESMWVERLGWDPHEVTSMANPKPPPSTSAPMPMGSRLVAYLLVCALGPLSEVDLRNLLTMPSGASLPLEALEGLIAPDDAGVVIRDRRAVAEVIATMSSEDRVAAERRLLEYGTEVFRGIEQGRILPQEVSSYVVEYHGAQLERRGAGLPELMALVSPAWHEAWATRAHGFLGFLTDVERARARAATTVFSATAEEARAHGIIAQVRCALVKSSVFTVAQQAIRERGEEGPPLSIGHLPMRSERHLDDGSDAAHALLGLAAQLSFPARALVLSWARRAAREAGDTWMLCAVAEASEQPVAADVAREARAARAPLRAPGEEEALARAARFLPEAEATALLQECFAAVRSSEAGGSERAELLDEFAHGLRDLPETLAAIMWPWAEALEPDERHFLLAALAPRLASPRREDAAAIAAHEVLAFLERGGLWSSASRELPPLAPLLVDPMLSACITVAKSLAQYSELPLPSLIERVAELGRGEDAIALADACDDDDARFEAHVRILGHLPPVERDRLAARLVSELQHTHSDTAASWLWRHSGRLSLGVPASDLLALARALDGPQRMHALVALADHVPMDLRREALAEAVAIARTLDDGNVDRLGDLVAHAQDLGIDDALYLFNRLLASLNDICLGARRGTVLLGLDSGVALGKMAPLFLRLGGETAVLGVAREIESVTSWFP